MAKVKRDSGVETIQTEPDELRDGAVRMRMRSASICGSDLGFYKFTAAFQRFAKIPVIMGHEFAGEVEEAGTGVGRFAPGDRVVCESLIYCGSCRFCKTGRTNICKNFQVFGMHRNGGFSEQVLVEPHLLHRLPDEVSFQEAAVIEPLTVAINAVEQIHSIGLGQSAVVVGPGPIGLLTAEVLRLRGVEDILVTGVDEDVGRLELARKKMGYRAMNWQRENATEAISRMTGGYGVDFAVVTPSVAPALTSVIPLVSKGGSILQLGLIPDDVAIPTSDLVRRQVSLITAYGSRPPHYEIAMELLKARKVKAKEMITHTFSLGQADDAFQAALSKSGCKVQFAS